MIKTIYILTLTLLICACGPTNPKSDHQENRVQALKFEDTTKVNQATEKLTKLDSIEKANNESIIASGDNITKAFVFLKDGDSTINLTANIRQDHRIFGKIKFYSPFISKKRAIIPFSISESSKAGYTKVYLFSEENGIWKNIKVLEIERW